jgi:hypothetical protein
METNMPGCILRVVGRKFDVDRFLDTSHLNPCAEYRRGEPILRHRPRGKKHQRSGFNVDVSRAAKQSIAKQAVQAVAFLKRYKRELRRLRRYPGVENTVLDFGVYERKAAAVQCEHLPIELIRLAGQLYLGIEVSIYRS